HDAYLSIMEALHHAGYARGVQVRIRWIDSEAFVPTDLAGVDGVLVPGGFGSRGIEGMIQAARCAREGDLPYLGICLGMQILCIEYARNVLGWADANSGEFDPDSAHKVIDFMPGQSDEVDKGGTLRLGSYPCQVQPGTTLRKYYALDAVAERHRHRYELNNAFRQQLMDGGLTFSGISPDGRLVEAAELTDRPFYVGVQYHPEFKSRPTKPHPLFIGLVEAALHHKHDTESERSIP
ncbi:MAG: gamma-glutamyl-gamma-aminobutyrate hydrolase family protein, partial [Clostridia bacterium]|nr:gamma-glutamyl-gamma-aminobutyrate hydrolase family protein [Clostridia bacterium]